MLQSPNLLKDRRIIVTGGAQGIGAATVRALVAAGAHVASFDLVDDLGREVAAAAGKQGPGSARYLRCDVARRGETKAAIDTAVGILGGLDGLIHVAGLLRQAPAEELDDDHWDLVLNVNARGTMNLNQGVFPHLKTRGGRIVNFASSAALRGMPGAAAYASAKGAVLGWSRTVAQEWGKYDITVNIVLPFMLTPMYHQAQSSLTPEEKAAQDAFVSAQVPIGGGPGNPDRDIAPVMVFLMSDGARFISGQTLSINGGFFV